MSNNSYRSDEDETLADLLFGPAVRLTGGTLEEDDLIQMAKETLVDQPFCVVRTWLILDVILQPADLQEIQSLGLQPFLLYANQVIFTNQEKTTSTHGVLSKYSSSFNGCIFESKDMIYVLAGRGGRKHASLWASSVLARQCGVNFFENYVPQSAAEMA